MKLKPLVCHLPLAVRPLLLVFHSRPQVRLAVYPLYSDGAAPLLHSLHQLSLPDWSLNHPLPWTLTAGPPELSNLMLTRNFIVRHLGSVLKNVKVKESTISNTWLLSFCHFSKFKYMSFIGQGITPLLVKATEKVLPRRTLCVSINKSLDDNKKSVCFSVA